MTSSTVSSKSQITLPAAACRAVGIKPHDRVLIEVRDRAIVVRAAPDLMALEGALGKALPPDVEASLVSRALSGKVKAKA
jgi:AbrB family looped-hinge helix DNA binding protein